MIAEQRVKSQEYFTMVFRTEFAFYKVLFLAALSTKERDIFYYRKRKIRNETW